MKVYIITYRDYDCDNDIKGVFVNEEKAEKCLKYNAMVVDIDNKKYGTYGRGLKLNTFECSDNIDFDAKIKELEKQQRKEEQIKYDEIKEKDLKEFERIKEKYGL